MTTSSHRTSSPSSSPSSNLVSASTSPAAATRAAASVEEGEADVAEAPGEVGADEVARVVEREVDVVADVGLDRRREDRAREARR